MIDKEEIRKRPRVVAVCVNLKHEFSKPKTSEIQLVKGKGVLGDAHFGETVKHRSRVVEDPTQPNLRQVHLMRQELFEELSEKGFNIEPGQIGENVTTSGIDLLSLPTGTKLKLGQEAAIEITGLRNPCVQLDGLQQGLMKAVLDKDENGELIRKAGVMAIVLANGVVKPGDEITVELPPEPFRKLEKV